MINNKIKSLLDLLEFYEYYSLLLVTKNVSRVTIKPVWEKFKTLQKILLWFSLVL